MFYRPRCDSAFYRQRENKMQICVYYCILHMQMWFRRNAKIRARICKLRFVLCFRYVNAIANNSQIKNKHQNESVSKPLHLCIKLACCFLQTQTWNMKMMELAETFMQKQGFRSRKVEKVLRLSAKVGIRNKPEPVTAGSDNSVHGGSRRKLRYHNYIELRLR